MYGSCITVFIFDFDGRSIGVMRTLVAKYPYGYVEWAKEKGKEVVLR